MLYNKGLDALAEIETAGFSWLLLKDTGYLFNRDHGFLTDLDLGTNEVSVTSYERVGLTGGTRTVDDILSRVVYSADTPDFGTLEAGDNVTAIVLALNGADDTDTVPVGFYNFATLDSGDMTPFTIEFADGTLAWVDEAP